MLQSSGLNAEADESARLRELDAEIEAIRALLRPQEEFDALRAEVARARTLLARGGDCSRAEVVASASREPRDPWQAAVELARRNPEPASLVFDSTVQWQVQTAASASSSCRSPPVAVEDSNIIKVSPGSQDPWQAAADIASQSHGPVSLVFDSVSQAPADTSVLEAVSQDCKQSAGSAAPLDPWQAAVHFASIDAEPVSLVFDSAAHMATGVPALKAVSKGQASPSFLPPSEQTVDCTTIDVRGIPSDPWQAAVDCARKTSGPASLVFDSGALTHQGHRVLKVAFQDVASEPVLSDTAQASQEQQAGMPDPQQQATMPAAAAAAAAALARRQKRRLQQLDAIAGQLHSQLRQRRGGSGTTTPAWATQSPASADAAASFRGSPATGGSSSVGTAAWSIASSAELLRREKRGKQLESQVKALARRFQALRDLR
eukprot:TRINITY_DN79040_c0_g1_i1.p1 TRINITY_DN79040_c0_g1~~TRINITY_DN79040_c0_g1_i1.p1  ORF type:complete len:432 (+),score=116.75 TRINITY_DN79040_c0_g1_i1:22-1317(+)